MTIRNLALLTFGLAVAACDASNGNKALQEEVIAVHDSIMPKMGLFVRNNLQLELLLNSMDSLKKANPSLDTIQEKQRLSDLQTNLQEASEAMTDWMHEFDPVQEDKKTDETQFYLQQELKKITELKQKFVEAEKQSELVLGAYK